MNVVFFRTRIYDLLTGKSYMQGEGMRMDIFIFKGLAEEDVCTVLKESLVDIRDVKIDRSKSREERISDYVNQVKKP